MCYSGKQWDITVNVDLVIPCQIRTAFMPFSWCYAIFIWTPLWLWIINMCIVIWGVFLNWTVLRQYHFIWICPLAPSPPPPTPPNRPILSHTSLSNRPSANILYSEISVKSGDGTWGNISKSRTAGSQPHKGSYYSSASGFWDLLCTCASDSLHGKC